MSPLLHGLYTLSNFGDTLGICTDTVFSDCRLLCICLLSQSTFCNLCTWIESFFLTETDTSCRKQPVVQVLWFHFWVQPCPTHLGYPNKYTNIWQLLRTQSCYINRRRMPLSLFDLFKPNIAFRICDQRRSLLSAYREYFKDVRWMVAESPGPKDFYCKRLQRGDPGDPHICILEKTGERSLKLVARLIAMVPPIKVYM